MLVSRRAGALTAFGNAVLLGVGGPDEAVEAVTGRDAVHRVVALPGEDEPVSLALALGRLRALGVQGLRLVLPEPGDLTGMPGPAAASAAATAAGSAVVTVAPPDVAPLALVPTAATSDRGDVVRWDVVPVEFSVAPYGLPTLSEAERSLAETMRETTEALDLIDVARGRDDVAGALARLETSVRTLPLPSSMEPRAQRAVVSATRLVGILGIAAEAESAAVTSAEQQRRADALRPLRRVAKHALCAAWSAAAEPSRGGPGTAR
ncbi:MAG TPA: hypothetical protein VFL59_13940 [Candidatus Nanopelagicales bacterium]|nr:hypothetical protein [Candidatus Nanopelagicales bacterium]